MHRWIWKSALHPCLHLRNWKSVVENPLPGNWSVAHVACLCFHFCVDKGMQMPWWLCRLTCTQSPSSFKQRKFSPPKSSTTAAMGDSNVRTKCKIMVDTEDGGAFGYRCALQVSLVHECHAYGDRQLQLKYLLIHWRVCICVCIWQHKKRKPLLTKNKKKRARAFRKKMENMDLRFLETHGWSYRSISFILDRLVLDSKELVDSSTEITATMKEDRIHRKLQQLVLFNRMLRMIALTVQSNQQNDITHTVITTKHNKKQLWRRSTLRNAPSRSRTRSLTALLCATCVPFWKRKLSLARQC